jgi:hypothetical protein
MIWNNEKRLSRHPLYIGVGTTKQLVNNPNYPVFVSGKLKMDVKISKPDENGN